MAIGFGILIVYYYQSWKYGWYYLTKECFNKGIVTSPAINFHFNKVITPRMSNGYKNKIW
jgi:hypothetical protein